MDIQLLTELSEDYGISTFLKVQTYESVQFTVNQAILDLVFCIPLHHIILTYMFEIFSWDAYTAKYFWDSYII